MNYSLIIADDDELIRKGIEKVIPWTELGFVVKGVFANGREALDYFRSSPSDVILTDVKMPLLSGLELIDEARKIKPDLKAVIISGFNEFDLVKSALTLKAEDYLLKPLSLKDIEELFGKLHRELDEKAPPGGEKSELEICFSLCRELYGSAKSVCGCVCGAGTNRFLLISYPPSKAAEAEIASVFGSSFMKSRSGYSLGLCPSETAAGNVDALTSYFRENGITDYRIAIGSSVVYVDDIPASLWRTYEVFENVKYSETGWYSNSQEQAVAAFVDRSRSRLIEIIEKGGNPDEEITAITEGAGNMGENDRMFVFSALVNKIARYFGVEDDIQSFRPGSAEFSAQSGESLADVFRRDMENVMGIIASNSGVRSRLLADRVRAEVDEHYSDPSINLGSIAEAMDVSYGYLSSVFSRITGQTFKSYLISVRLENARKLLLTRKYRVYEIASMVGYSSFKYFTESFHRKYGASPGDYIRNLHGKV